MILISTQKLLSYFIGLTAFYNGKSKEKYNNKLKINIFLNECFSFKFENKNFLLCKLIIS